jgi:benzoyl-CoA reductase/2-hydroxyglutaryl-CoA dehydratase subunit BcrC/BadD/HgdB
MNRCVENIDLLKLCDKEKFFISYSDVPMKSDETALRHYVKQMRIRVLEQLSGVYGVDVSDAALRAAVLGHNEACRLITAIGEYRKEDNPRITGYEFAVLCTATYCCPKDLLVDKLRETLDELGSRQPDSGKNFRARVVVAGSEIDNPDLIRLIEGSGALVVADRFCFGSLPGRQEIVLNDGEDVLLQICRQYLAWGKCARFMDTAKIEERQSYIDELAKSYHADGIIFEQQKFCDYWGYERALGSRVMRDDYGYPVLSVDLPYAVGTNAQLRTRVQAFVESIEIKNIQGKVTR